MMNNELRQTNYYKGGLLSQVDYERPRLRFINVHKLQPVRLKRVITSIMNPFFAVHKLQLLGAVVLTSKMWDL